MFVKLTTSGGRQYVKLVEAFRDEHGVARQRVIATLGRLESVRAGQNDALLNGLLRVSGKPTLDEGTGEMAFAPALSVGDTWMLTALWKELGFAEQFRRVLRNRRQFDAECLLRVMVFNVSNGMDAPTRNGIECAKVEVSNNHLNREGRHHGDYNDWH